MRYILLGDSAVKDSVNKIGKVQLSGLYQWANVFQKYGLEGEIQPYWRSDDLEKYDIVHINYTPSNIQLPTLVKQELKDSSTKIVLNVDLDVSKWSHNWAYHIINMINEIKLADIVFHVETTGLTAVKQLTNKHVHLCPHPVDVSGLYDHIVDPTERENMIGTIFHRYTGDTLTQYLAQKNIPLRKVLFGFMQQKEKLVASQGMYDQILKPMKFVDFIDEIAKSLIGCDLYDGFSYGRVPIEFAALGIPAVVSNRIGSSCLYPYTSVDPYDIMKASTLFMELYSNEEFANKVITTAHERCSYYSLKNSFNRFKTMVEEDK